MSRWLLMLCLLASAMWGCDSEESAGEGQPGDACETPSDCASGVCIRDPAVDRLYCTTDCVDGCASGFSCDEASGACVLDEAAAGGAGGGAGAPVGGGMGPIGGGAGGEGGEGGMGPVGGGGVGGEGGGEPPPPGELSCLEVVQCQEACGQNDEACLVDCVEQGSQQAQSQYITAVQCIEANNGDQAACQAEIQACVGGGGGNPPPAGDDLSCSEMLTCFQGCGQNDQACLQDCFQRSTPQAQQLYNSIAQCIEANGGNQEACQNEIQACFGDNGGGGGNPPPGDDLSCNEMLGCFQSCGQNDQACLQNCFQSATPQAQQLYNTIAECIEANGGDQEACQNEIQACFNDGGGGGNNPPPGEDLSCSEVLNCFNGCGQNDQACLQGCFMAGTPEAQQIYNDAAVCVQENNGDQSACEAEIQACIDDT
ncbi:MAG: hypothetical protein ACE366_10075 [Bradymonadia bacterium]